MRRSITTICMLAASAVVPLGCSGEESSRAASDEFADTSATRGATVKVRSTRYGRILVDGRGIALYLFTRESTRRSRCYGACAKAWPPFLTRAQPRPGRGARAGLVATTTRRDGKRQVTYNGHPLYYYVGDREPGQVLCQDVFEYGGRWLVVNSAGRAIR